MASDLKAAGAYRLLYYQPAPETGERIAIALLLEDGRNAFLHYDEHFAKLRRVYPWLDLAVVKFYLEDLRAALNKSTNIEATLNLYGPQLVASDSRRIALPITETLVDLLIHKFVLPAAKAANVREERPLERPVDAVAQSLQAYVKSGAGRQLKFRAGADARTVLGRKAPGIGAVALAIESSSGWTLVDGVDLNLLTPNKTMERADHVARTFWRYSRETAHPNSPKVHKIGLVLNGLSHLKPPEHDAHDYAIHRLEVDADEAIDAASTEAIAKLREALRGD
jgi:hypothetical protein